MLIKSCNIYFYLKSGETFDRIVCGKLIDYIKINNLINLNEFINIYIDTEDTLNYKL